MSKPPSYFRFKSIRDPLYGFVDLSETEIRIIDTPVFRRLHRIKQLSHAYLAYPSAIHTRFEHALGVTYLADLVSKQLSFDDDTREIVRLAGLLHDVGHGPFSHLFENVLEDINGKKIDHDKISMMLINEDPDLCEILGERGERVIQLLDHKPVSGWDKKTSMVATDVVSGPLDVDKMDYLRRDSYHIGVAYGQFDLPRIIHTLTTTDDQYEQRVCIGSKGKDAVENYRLGRYLMHAQVYKHHARLVGDLMFLRALGLATQDGGIIHRDSLCTDTDLKKSHKEFLEFYTGLDDHNLYDRILRKDHSEAACILKRITNRRLLKRACEFLPETEIPNAQIRDRILKMKRENLKSMSDEIADEFNIKRHDVIAFLSEIPVNLYGGEILLMWKGVPRKLDEFSPINIDRLAINRFYIFCPNDPAAKEGVKRYVKNKFEINAE